MNAEYSPYTASSGIRYNTKYICEKCGELVTGAGVLRGHKDQCIEFYQSNSFTQIEDGYESDLNVAPSFGLFKYECICCTFKTNFKDHIESHSESHRRICPYCAQCLSGISAFFTHISEYHHDEHLIKINKVLDADNVSQNLASLNQ